MSPGICIVVIAAHTKTINVFCQKTSATVIFILRRPLNSKSHISNPQNLKSKTILLLLNLNSDDTANNEISIDFK